MANLSDTDNINFSKKIFFKNVLQLPILLTFGRFSLIKSHQINFSRQFINLRLYVVVKLFDWL